MSTSFFENRSPINSIISLLSSVCDLQATYDAKKSSYACKMVYEPAYAKRMYCSSHLGIICVLCAYYHSIYDVMIMSLAVLLTSLNYWRLPCFGIRRTMDIVICQIALWYSFYSSLYYLTTGFFMLQLCGMVLYAVAYFSAIYFGIKGDQHHASCCHVALHVLGTTFNVLLSRGLYMRNIFTISV